MKFVLDDKARMLIEHGSNKPIAATIREFSKTKFITTDSNGSIIDPFIEINKYLATLKRDELDKIFECYQRIFSPTDGMNLKAVDLDILCDMIRDNLKIIFDIVTVEDIQEYMEKHDMFEIPPSISADFTGEYLESRTFNQAKYKGLISLSIATRMVIPIWGEFAPLQKQNVGASRLPIPMLKMLVGTTVLDSPQFKDYEVYSNTTVGAGEHKQELIASGLGTEFNVTINLAANFVKRVATGLNIKSNTLARNIYNFTANDGAYNDGSGGDYVYAKKDIGGEEEKSKMEKYALREPMSQGDVALIEYYLSDLRRFMTAVCPDIPDSYIADAELLFNKLEEEAYLPNEVNIRLVQWVAMYLLPPQVISYVGFTYQRKALAGTTYLIAYLGFPKLSALCVSYTSTSKDGNSVQSWVTRREMPESIKKALDEYYPLRPKSKEANNMAILAINEFYALLNNTVFKVTANERFTEYLDANKILNNHRVHTVKSDTPIDLANLVIAINKLGYEKVEDNHNN